MDRSSWYTPVRLQVFPKISHTSGRATMARTVRNAKLETGPQRVSPVASAAEPYWLWSREGCALGYRRGPSGGTWLARRCPATGRDDEHYGSAPRTICRTRTALRFSLRAGAEESRAHGGAPTRRRGRSRSEGPFRVADALADYLKAFERRGGKSVYRHAHGRPKRTSCRPSGPSPVAKLTAKKIEDWHHGLAEKPASPAASPAGSRTTAKRQGPRTAIRKRRATANRILTVLKAALNHAWKAVHVASDDAWRRV